MICLLSILCAAAAAEATPSIGAIRWDGWFAGNTWEKNLAPEQWHSRLPFYGEKLADGTVAVRSDSQEVMDREIAYAKAGGIAYWAFCYYHPKSWDQADAYNYGWKRYLASSHKSDIGFCILLQGGSHMGPAAEWPETVARFIEFFREPTYQKVCGGRPLVYIFSCENIVPHFGSAENARAALDRFRSDSVKAGAGEPYIVAQIWLNQLDEGFLDGLGFDAFGSYSAHGDSKPQLPYSRLMEINRSYWERFKATGKDVVPLVNAGWDGRPRNYSGSWFVEPTPAELAQNLRNAFDWIGQNPAAAKANTVLVYAWNEHDEGGWLSPTIAEGTARLDAIHKLVDDYTPQPATP